MIEPKDTIVHVLRGETEAQCVYCGESVWVNSPDDSSEPAIALFIDTLDVDVERGSWNVCTADCATAMLRILNSYVRPEGDPMYGYHYNRIHHERPRTSGGSRRYGK